MRKILLLLLVCFGALKALSQIKVVPFIYYVPVDFERNLRGSFLFNPTRPCFIKQNNKLYLYSNYQNDKFEYKEMNIKKNISTILISKDSTFVFSTRMDYGNYNGVVSPNAIQYIGYIQNDSVYYYNIKKNTVYSSIDSFGSLQKFVENYTNSVISLFYNVNIKNGIYQCRSVIEAKNSLLNDFCFPYMTNILENYDLFFSRLMNLLREKLKIDKKKYEDFYFFLKNVVRNDISVDFLDDYGSIPFDKTILNVFFTESEISVIEDILLERALNIGKCYSYLLQNENLIIDSKDLFLSDKDYLYKILDYVRDRNSNCVNP
mgnify:CR=1 FL=1